MDRLKLYNLGRVVPEEAKKKITGGRLNGFTDINPMFRIKRLTEMFGPCGIGWWYEITDKRLEHDPKTDQTAAFMDILLFYKDPDTGEVSHGIPGTGGSSFVAKENKGYYMSDECFKMALTDAISVAAKAIGICADVYYEKDRSKYDKTGDTKEEEHFCENCKNTIVAYCDDKGKAISVERHVSRSQELYGKTLCIRCIQKGVGCDE